MNKYLIIINPVSGLKKSIDIAKNVKQKFKSNNITFDCLKTEYKGHAMQHIKDIEKTKYKSIIAVGGDGTYHEIINGLLNRKDNYNPILGFIPAGSGNSLMHDLKCLNPNKAIDRVLKQNNKKLDIMELKFKNKIEYAFNILGWGLATDIGILAEKIRWIGPSRYTLASLVYILKLNKRFATTYIDDIKYSNHFIFILICNTVHTGNGMMAAPKAKVDDGLLDVIILNKAISRFQLLRLLPTLFKGEHIKNPHVEYRRAKKITLNPATNEILNIDGEIKNYTPVTITVLKHKFSIYA